MALCQRRPGLGLLHHSDHSDRGSQYASTAFQDKLGTAGIVSSMSRRGNLSESGFRCAGTTPLWRVSSWRVSSGRGEFLRDIEERDGESLPLRHAGAGKPGGVRVYRGLGSIGSVVIGAWAMSAPSSSSAGRWPGRNLYRRPVLSLLSAKGGKGQCRPAHTQGTYESTSQRRLLTGRQAHRYGR